MLVLVRHDCGGGARLLGVVVGKRDGTAIDCRRSVSWGYGFVLVVALLDLGVSGRCMLALGGWLGGDGDGESDGELCAVWRK
jgi:hypothetical protein